MRHVGDLGNVESDGKSILISITDKVASLFGVNTVRTAFRKYKR